MSATLATGGGSSAPPAEGGGTTGQTHTAESDLRHRSTPPAENCPVGYKPSLDKMDVGLRLILAECRVPWLLQHLLAEAEIVTTADLSQACTKELLHSNYKADFGLHDVYNYPTISETRSIGRLQSALKRSDEEQGERSKRRQSELDVINETSNSERHNMETVYKSIQQNDIGDFCNNQIISKNPDSADKTYKTRRRDNSASVNSKDADEESRQDPRDYESWERQMTIWRSTLLMCIWSNPQEIRLQITKAELDEFYDYLLGDDIYKRKPQPSLKTMMISERKAWRKIREHLHKGTTLAAALKLMMNDFLFWTREVYEYLRAPTTGPKGGPKGGQWPKGAPNGGYPTGGPKGGTPKGYPRLPTHPYAHPRGPCQQQPQQHAAPYNTPQQHTPQQPAPQHHAPQPPNAGKLPKGKGKGKGQQPKGTPGKTGPSQWAAVDASGTAFCKNYHIRDNCPGGCSLSHICPIIKQGWMCPEMYRAALQEPEAEPTDNDFKLPDNYIILILYAGKDDQGSTAAAIQQEAPHLSQYVVEIDIMRDKQRQNMLNDQPYKQLLQAAKQGRLLAILGGPNCRTLSVRLLHDQADGSPGKPLRGRGMDEIWGLPHNTPEEQSKVDSDSILLLRMLHLANVARFYNKSSLLFLLEHPADPALHSPHPGASNCATIWGTATLLAFGHEHRLFGSTFAQCMVGNMVNKITKLLHNIPLLRQLDNLTCNHTTHKKVHDTKQLARWGWHLNVLIAQGVKARLKFLRNYDHTQILTDRPHDITTGGLPQQNEMIIQIGHKQRPPRDGGGKPSPGRLPPNKRPASKLQHLGAALAAYVMTQPTQSEAHLLQHGSISDCPFTDEQITEARNIMNNSTTHQLDNPSQITTGQPFTLPLLSSLELTAGDPDWEFPLHASDALPLGVTDVLPRTPGIWPTTLEMNEYNEDCEQPEPPSDVPNYPSAAEHEDRIEATYIEERGLDMTSGPHDRRTVARLCNCREDQISCGALSGKLEGRYLEKLRTIHDAAVNSVNLWIQRNQPERTAAPGLFDLLYAIYYLRHMDTTRHTILKTDVTKAHRRMLIKQQDWRYMVAMIKDMYWINEVGTYGVASAQYRWGRMAALILRLLYYTFPQIAWAFVYVGDYLIILPEDADHKLPLRILLFLTALGLPLSWKKTGIGISNTWLGYQVNITNRTAHLTPTKHITITAILRKLAEGKPHSHKEIESLVGRLLWTTYICPTLRPFLQPLWGWMKVITTSGRPSALLRLLATTMLYLIEQPATTINPTPDFHILHGATDAGANSHEATIGGWFTTHTTPSKDQVFWFSTPITKSAHPWAYHKDNNPQRAIAAIELYGTLVLQQLITHTTASSSSAITVKVRTDNKGNVYNVLNYKAKQWPNYAILMELVIKEDGFVKGLWAPGIVASVVRDICNGGIRMGLYPAAVRAVHAQVPWGEKQQAAPNFATRVLAGLLTGFSGALIGNPTDVIKVRLQAEAGTVANGVYITGLYKGQAPSPTTFSCLAELVSSGGWFRGVGANCARAALVTSGQMSAYDQTKRILEKQSATGPFQYEGVRIMTASFVSGVTAATVAAPVDLVRSRIMDDRQRPGQTAAYKNALDCAWRTVKAEGPFALWKGWVPSYLRLGPHFMVSLPLLEVLRTQVFGLGTM
ncbi:unnamed protein product [Polarella glacialis]|uniref:Uncharacterized protein n=1 Tax=Polarella glacialis TaxID=89957 RepID=A0A813L974_POLGL|nr:unnamed protein product [Polarella glacialis]